MLFPILTHLNHLFHSLDLGERRPEEVFSNTVQFLEDFPSEVIVFFFEASGDRGPISWTEVRMVDLIFIHCFSSNDL